MILCACSAVSLPVIGLVAAWLLRDFTSSALRDVQEAKAGAEQLAPIPPDTAKPVGEPSSWIKPSDYPGGALRAGEEGRARVTLAIDAAGKPTGCAVARSSGSWSLDNGTCSALMRRARFAPARPGTLGSHEGEVRRWTSPYVRWVLPD